MQNETISQLISELKNFGLNPNHWTLTHLTENETLIQNRDDQDLMLKGTLQKINSALSFESLEWVL